MDKDPIKDTAVLSASLGSTTIAWVTNIDTAIHWIAGIASCTVSLIALYEYCKKKGWVK